MNTITVRLTPPHNLTINNFPIPPPSLQHLVENYGPTWYIMGALGVIYVYNFKTNDSWIYKIYFPLAHSLNTEHT